MGKSSVLLKESRQADQGDSFILSEGRTFKMVEPSKGLQTLGKKKGYKGISQRNYLYLVVCRATHFPDMYLRRFTGKKRVGVR